MNYRYHIGRTLNNLEIAMLGGPMGRMLERYPMGRHWPFDIARIRGSEPSVVFDVGANVGMTTKYIRCFYPNAQIHAFEPVSSTFAALKSEVAGDRRVIAQNIALGAQDEIAVMEVDQISERSTLVVSGSSERQKEDVRVRKLDSYRAEQGIERVDVLKMDVQGFESKVLLGCEQSLKEKLIDFIYLEVGFVAEDREMAYFPEVHELLRARQFELTGFYEISRFGLKKQKLGFCNALYTHTHW